MSLIPNVGFNQKDGNTGAVQQATTGVLAVIAFCSLLPANKAASFTRIDDALTQGGIGPGIEYSSYYFNGAKKPVVLINPTCSTAGAYGTIDHTGVLGTATIAATGAPLDEYDVIVKVLTGGTLGTAGITYQYSLDGGNSFSATQALGTGLVVACNLQKPAGTVTNVSFTLSTTGVGTLLAGDFWRVQTTRPKMNNSDLTTALEALRITQLPWDNVLIDADATSTLVSTVDSWLSGLEGGGANKMAWMCTRHKNTPAPATETEATYLTFLGTLFTSTATTRVDVSADGGDTASTITGLLQIRPASLAIATRANPSPVGQDPSEVDLGPVPGMKLTDSAGAPKWHNEDTTNGNPGVDALRLSTLRTFPGKQGTFITNANILSTAGSDFVYDQHTRAMNAAKNVAYPLYQNQLSKGYRKGPPDPNTGAIYILEDDAAAIDGYVNPQLTSTLQGQVNDVQSQISRQDDVSSNAGATFHITLQVQALAYGKAIAVTNSFVKSIVSITQAA